MIDRKPENPPLFEDVTGEDLYRLGTRITLRDLFAAAALAGNLAKPDSEGSFAAYARDAYRQADTLLAEREERS